MDSNNKAIESAKMAVAAAASLAASAMLARSLIDQFLPSELHDFLSSTVDSLRSRLSSQHTIVIDQMEGFSANQIYDAANTFLSTKLSTSTRRVRVSKVDDHDNENKRRMTVSIEPGEELIDIFEGVQFKWRLFCQEEQRSSSSFNGNNRLNLNPTSSMKVCTYELSFHKKYKEKAFASYLPYIQDRAEEIKAEDKTLKLYMNEDDYWTPTDLHHPTTFDTLAMDSDLKKTVMDDLARFVKRKDYYKKIGKAWKRGYLFYGPPGTGKSSLIAAMANYLKFDIYDLELTEVRWNSALRKLLVGTSNRSIVVVEDIDCSIEIKDREQISEESAGDRRVTFDGREDEKVTLSGLLNFVDGLWSSCGEERIIVFTTNYKERLDQALLRPGRMDMHIHMGYCSMSAFRVLASNYHDLKDHPLFGEIEELLKEVEVTPAEVAEELMRSDDEEIALGGLVEFIREKKTKADAEASEAKEDGVEND